MKSNYRHLAIILALAAIVLSTLACSFSTVNFEKGSARVTVSLHESEINTLLEHSTNDIKDKDEDFLLNEVTSVELHEGYIRAFGPYNKTDGSQATGSYDATVKAVNGELEVVITNVDIDGVTLSDARVERLNKRIADELSRSARESKDDVRFESVEITDSALTVQVVTNWDSR